MVEVLGRFAQNLRRLAWYREGGSRPADVEMIAKALPQLKELSLFRKGIRSGLDKYVRLPDGGFRAHRA